MLSTKSRHDYLHIGTLEMLRTGRLNKQGVSIGGTLVTISPLLVPQATQRSPATMQAFGSSSRVFADRDRTAVSVGENAVLVLKASRRDDLDKMCAPKWMILVRYPDLAFAWFQQFELKKKSTLFEDVATWL